MKKLLATLALLLLLPVAASGAELSREQSMQLKETQVKLAVVQDLSRRGIITVEEAARANSLYCEQSAGLTGKVLTPAEVNALAAGADKKQGFGVFLNTVIVLAGVALLLSLIGLVVYYLRDLWKVLPAEFYEGAAYVLTGGLLASGLLPPFDLWFLTVRPVWLVVPGALAFSGCVYLSYWLHWLSAKRAKTDYGLQSDHFYAGPGLVTFPQVVAGLCALLWGAVAVGYHALLPDAGVPHFLAFIAMMALQSFLGFSIVTLPFGVVVGWTKDGQVPRSTAAAFVLLVFYVLVRLSGGQLPEALHLFEAGSLFMGGFVYYLGLLILSNKFYQKRYRRAADGTMLQNFSMARYLWLQALTVLSGLAALYLGATFHVGPLLGIGGTFFTLYLLEKYYEIPWKGVGWAWSMMGVAVALYFFVGFAGHNPQYFIWGMR